MTNLFVPTECQVAPASSSLFSDSSVVTTLVDRAVVSVDVSVNWGWFSLSPSRQRPQTGPFAIPRIYH